MANRVLRDWTDSEKIHELSACAERFFTRLIMKADDFGCYPANPMLLKSTLFPLHDQLSVQEVTKWLTECKMKGVIKPYTVDNKQYIQIIEFNQRLRIKKSKYPAPPDAPHAKEGDDGYVYLIGSDYDSPVKVGFSLNPWSRVKEISTGSHEELSVLLTFKASKKTESQLHRFFKDFRTRNEWFRLPKDVIDVLIRHANDELPSDLFVALRSCASLLRSTLETETKRNETKGNELRASVDLIPSDKAPETFTSQVSVPRENLVPPFEPPVLFKSKSEAFESFRDNYQVMDDARKTLSGRGWSAVDEVSVLGLVKMFLDSKAKLEDPPDEIKRHFKNWIFREPIKNLTEIADNFKRSLG